jgi:hypothetical protein
MPGRTDFQHIYPREMQVMTPQTFNHVMDMTRMHRQNGGKVGMPSFEGNTGRDITILRVLNKTDYNLNAGSILGIDGPVFTYEDNPGEFCFDPSINGVVPALSDHIDKFCILIESAQKQDGDTAFLADAAVCGVVPVAVKMVSKWHTYARIDEGQTFALVSDVGGYPILWMSDTDATPPNDANGDPNYQGDDDSATYRLCLVAIGGNARNIAPWTNTGTDSVGQHGLFRSTGVNTSTKDYQALEGEQPSDTVGKSYFVNGSTEVEADGWGVYQTGNELAVMIGDSSAPDVGDMLGPKADHWGAYKAGSPSFLRMLGTIDTGSSTDDIVMLAAKAQPAVNPVKLVIPQSYWKFNDSRSGSYFTATYGSSVTADATASWPNISDYWAGQLKRGGVTLITGSSYGESFLSLAPGTWRITLKSIAATTTRIESSSRSTSTASATSLPSHSHSYTVDQQYWAQIKLQSKPMSGGWGDNQGSVVASKLCVTCFSDTCIYTDISQTIFTIGGDHEFRLTGFLGKPYSDANTSPCIRLGAELWLERISSDTDTAIVYDPS